MSRARSSLVIIGGGKALLGSNWWNERPKQEAEGDLGAEERMWPQQLETIDFDFQVDSKVGELKTHQLNFRAFFNSARQSGYPIQVVKAR